MSNDAPETMGAMERIARDAKLLGAGYSKTLADGSVEYLDPRQLYIEPENAEANDYDVLHFDAESKTYDTVAYGNSRPYVPATPIEALIATARNEALEEAAKRCEQFGEVGATFALQIRALKTEQGE